MISYITDTNVCVRLAILIITLDNFNVVMCIGNNIKNRKTEKSKEICKFK